MAINQQSQLPAADSSNAMTGETVKVNPELVERFRTLLAGHSRRANQYRLINVGLAGLLAVAVLGGIAILIVPPAVFRRPLVYLLWALVIAWVAWLWRRRRWNETAMGLRIDQVMNCDNLLRSAWLGMQQPVPGAFLEMILQKACQIAAQFALPRPWPLAGAYALRAWLFRRQKRLWSTLFYLFLLLLLALWLYTLLTHSSSSVKSDQPAGGPSLADRSPASGASDTPAGRTSPERDRSLDPSSTGSPTSGSAAQEGKTGGDPTGANRAQPPAEDASGSGSRSGDGAQGQASKTSGGETGATGLRESPGQAAARGQPGSAGGETSQTHSQPAGDSSGIRPGSGSIMHRSAGASPDAARANRLIVMPGLEGASTGDLAPSLSRGARPVKTAGRQQEAEEVRPPGRIPREYERFLKKQ